MTKDVIALTEKMPDPMAILAGLYAGGPDLEAQTLHDGAVIQLSTPQGRPLLSVESPLLIHVPGEVTRLLGPDMPVPDGPVWWTEARASTALPEAERLAASFAGRLNTILGGTTWPQGTATLDVVELTPESAALTAADETQPAVDVLTDQAAVIISDRSLIPMSTWLSDVLRTAATNERALQIVTPPHARLTLPTRTALGGHPNRWVVSDETCGYYDGLSGAVLRWRGGAFVPARTVDGQTHVAQAFTTAADTGERQLLLSLRTRHTLDQEPTLGAALEACWQALTGTPPMGWGTAEPINLPWSTRTLTELVRNRAPEPSWLTAVGHPDRPAIATLLITRTATGVEEEITLAIGYGPGDTPPLDTIQTLAATLAAEHGLITLLTSLRGGRRDLTTSPHLEAPPIPVAFTLGAEDINEIGLAHANRPPLALRPAPLGPAKRPALHYRLGDGTDVDTWQDLEKLIQHLKQAPPPATA
ncbi:hypothetical protein BGM19_26950 [Streptomyces agglomeratus]|uniref:DUF6177 family protein n=1 Tax=Streptomyces agglomeratus TaxID=285458 RepID=UPI00086F3112|nr:DUF6177 family protein [Streptomyces agglomeratus]OEJ61112.1 hypothetical protein BGM19_26950 [Streptomyces agglomeratus]